MKKILNLFNVIPEELWIIIGIIGFVFLCWHFSTQQYKRDKKEKEEKIQRQYTKSA